MALMKLQPTSLMIDMMTPVMILIVLIDGIDDCCDIFLVLKSLFMSILGGVQHL